MDFLFKDLIVWQRTMGNKDYAPFLAIARGSLYETITQLELAKELGYTVCQGGIWLGEAVAGGGAFCACGSVAQGCCVCPI